MKSTPIHIVCEESPMQALIIRGSVPLEEVIDQFAHAHGRYSIFLTDAEGRLAGVVNNKDLMDWARLRFDLGIGEHRIAVGRVRRLLSARTINDLALPDSHRMSVQLDQTVAEAMRKMAAYDLDNIAVVDDLGRVVNDLRLSEVLSFALRLHSNGN